MVNSTGTSTFDQDSAGMDWQQRDRANRDFAEQSWQTFITTRQIDPTVNPLVAVSWRRCAPRINPLQPPTFVTLNAGVFPLVMRQSAHLRQIARPILEDVYQYCDGTEIVLMLTNAIGCVLETLGDVPMRSALDRQGIQPSVFLDESRIGTSAFSIAFVDGSPAHVTGAEHFLSALHGVVTIAAPVFSPEGAVIAVVGLIATADRPLPLGLALIASAAHAIEVQLVAEVELERANIQSSELSAILHTISEGVLVWNAHGLITHLNRKAGELLGLSPKNVVGRPLNEHVLLPEALKVLLAAGIEQHEVEASLLVDGVAQDYLLNIQVMRGADDAQQSYLATLRPLESVHHLVNRLAGGQARQTLDEVIGSSPSMRRIRRQVQTAARASGTVVLQGETGTGKSTLARAIHHSSARADRPFVTVNCRAIPRDLALGELIGYEGGTGRTFSPQPSKFELASGGTLYLSEIDALSLDSQAALLHVLDADSVTRIGGQRAIPIDVRVIASCTYDLQEYVNTGAFRRDLSQRLSVFVISLLPLRKRPDDIPPIIAHVLERLNRRIEHPVRIDDAVVAQLTAYDLPGNITELEMIIERAALNADSGIITKEHLPPYLLERTLHPADPYHTPLPAPVRSLRDSERAAIVAAGRSTHGNLTQTAQLLGIGRSTLWRKMKEMNLLPTDFN